MLLFFKVITSRPNHQNYPDAKTGNTKFAAMRIIVILYLLVCMASAFAQTKVLNRELMVIADNDAYSQPDPRSIL